MEPLAIIDLLDEIGKGEQVSLKTESPLIFARGGGTKG